MEQESEIEQFESLPLRSAYYFLEVKGFNNEATEIRVSKDKYKSYHATLKRGKIVALLEKNRLLDAFIDTSWPFAKTEKGKKKISKYKRIYNEFMGTEAIEEEEEEESTIGEAFAYETDLRDYLAKNPSKIQQGLKLHTDKDGKEDGVEYPIDEEGRRVDILAIDSSGVPVIVELKVSRGHERVIGQALYYKNRVKEMFGTTKARIVIIAREITPELRIASEGLPDCELFEYDLSVNLRRIDVHTASGDKSR